MKIFYSLLLLFFVASCTTGKKDFKGPATDVGIWQGKVLMTNKTTDFKKWAYVTWASDSPNNRMRVNVSAVFDQPVATFLKKQESNDLWLFLEGKHFQSDDGRKLFEFLTKLSLDPKIFYSLLGTPRSPGTEWQCNKKEQVMSCISKAYKTRFSVEYEDRNKRLIEIDRGSKALQIRLTRSKVQVEDKLFTPLRSSQFKTIKI